MKKTKLKTAVDARKATTKEALELIISCITAKGQRKKIYQNPEARALLESYGVEIPE